MKRKIYKKKKAEAISLFINEFGEVVLSKNYEEINAELDRNLFDKKNRIPTINKNHIDQIHTK